MNKLVSISTLLTISILALMSCGEEKSAKHDSAEVQQKKVLHPKSIAFLDDQSGSREQVGIPPLQIEDLEPAIRYVIGHGGAVLVGVISANSDYTTVQFRIDPARVPEKPSKPKKSDFTNKFSFYQAVNKYKEQVLPDYRKDSAAYVQQVIRKAEKFKVDAEELLTTKRNSSNTDIVNAINRSLYFHQTAPEGAKHYTVLISDGIATTKGQLTNPNQLPVEYYCAYGSSQAKGHWIDTCNPVMTPDLVTALEMINLY